MINDIHNWQARLGSRGNHVILYIGWSKLSSRNMLTLTNFVANFSVLRTSVWLFPISSQKKTFLATPDVENKLWSLKVLLKWSWWWFSFSCVLHNFFALWSFFSRAPMGNCFWCNFSHLLISLTFRKCKKGCNIRKVILVY